MPAVNGRSRLQRYSGGLDNPGSELFKESEATRTSDQRDGLHSSVTNQNRFASGSIDGELKLEKTNSFDTLRCGLTPKFAAKSYGLR
jgi:hypothetical protein